MAFLPISPALMISATTIGARLLPRVGPQLLITTGGLVAAAGMVLLTRIELDSSYATVVLPGLVVLGLGLGLIFSSAMATATAGIDRRDAGVASATVNTMQQVGGSIGTALLGTVSANAITVYLSGRDPSPQVQAAARMQGYHVAFWCSAAGFALVALVGATVLQRQSVRLARAAEGAPAEAETVAVH